MITFVGQIDGSHVKAAVLLNGDIVSIDGPVWFTLDQWQTLRDEFIKEEDESDIWPTTPDEYETSTGERVTP